MGRTKKATPEARGLAADLLRGNINSEFHVACRRLAHVIVGKGGQRFQPTLRQARKWMAHKGLAWKCGRAEVANE